METIRGWVWNVRDIGKLKFILLRTFPENRIEQVVVKKGNVPDDVLEEAGKFNPETLLEMRGEWKESPKAPNGREFVASSITVIADSLPTPIDQAQGRSNIQGEEYYCGRSPPGSAQVGFP